MRRVCALVGIVAALSVHARESRWSTQNKQQATQQFEQGDAALGNTVGSAYSYPARVDPQDSYNTFATVSYLYWFAGEDGLDVGTTAQFNGQIVGLTPNVPVSSTISLNEKYSSGFKLGVGYDLPTDDWVIRADYTRFHQQTHMSQTADFGGTRPVIQLTNWFYQVSPSRSQTPGVTHLSGKWRLSVDWLDLVLERAFYEGRRLTLTPFMGLRASWITQTIVLEIDDIVNFSSPPPHAKSYNTSHAWALGPRFGIKGQFLLGAGIRFQGAAAGMILYNKYTHVKHHEDSLFPNNPNSTPLTFLSRNSSNVRTMTEANLGFGWGMYFGSQYHLDISATYDFNYLPEQNQMRDLNDVQIEGINAASKALYLHGLTLTTTFNF